MSFCLFTLSLHCQLHPKVGCHSAQKVAATNLHAICFLFHIQDGGVGDYQKQIGERFFQTDYASSHNTFFLNLLLRKHKERNILIIKQLKEPLCAETFSA